MAVPTDATDVFAIDTRTGSEPSFVASFEPDMAIKRNRSVAVNNSIAARLTGNKELVTNDTAAESSDSGFLWDYMGGWANDGSANSDVYSWMWKRAPNYFDVVAYTGNGTAGRTVSHNLGVAPEMMWIKARDGARAWRVYHSSFTNGSVRLNSSAAKDTSTNYFSTPTADNIVLGSDNDTNSSSYDYIAYLFASLDGVSKVGSFTSDGTDMTIDCGFSSGARFVLLKKTNASDDWFVWDTERGIATGNDKRLKLNDTSAEATGADNIDPDNSGFIINNNILGGSGNTFIFYAIA
jgi:hypothetical protein